VFLEGVVLEALEALGAELGAVLFVRVLLVVLAQELALLKDGEEREVEVDGERTSQYLRRALWMLKWIGTFLTEQRQIQI
jgi:hypothetical protein